MRDKLTIEAKLTELEQQYQENQRLITDLQNNIAQAQNRLAELQQMALALTGAIQITQWTLQANETEEAD